MCVGGSVAEFGYDNADCVPMDTVGIENLFQVLYI